MTSTSPFMRARGSPAERIVYLEPTPSRLLADVPAMRNQHLHLERTWRRYAIAMAWIGVFNIIGAVVGDALNAAFAVGTSALLVFSVRQAQLSRDIAAHCSLFLAVMGDEE